ncbi:hypothetical protein CHUAL_005446 [Chamberlinius hualienensis]
MELKKYLKACMLLLMAGCCFTQEPASPLPASNVRVAYNAPNGHYLVEDRSIDGTSLLGNFGYQSIDGQSVGVAYSSDGAGFVISAPDTASTVDQISFSNRNQQAGTTSSPVATARRGSVRPSSIPATINHAASIDDMITQLDSRPSPATQRQGRRRRPRKQRPVQRQEEGILIN